MYLATKHFHMLCVAFSVGFFLLRFYWLQVQSPLFQRKLVKVLPHIVDTLLLASAVALCVLLHQYPLVDNWLTQKVIAVVAYIGFGIYTFKKATSGFQRFAGLSGAIACIGLAAHTAMSKSAFF